MNRLVALMGLCLLTTVSSGSVFACYEQIENQMYSLENSTADASGNLQAIDRLVNDLRVDYCDAGRAFILVLKSMGSGETSEVRRAFGILGQLSQLGRGQMTPLARESVQIIEAENAAVDATNTINVVLKISDRHRLIPLNALRAADVLTRGMGSGETSQIQGTLEVLGTMVQAGAGIHQLADKALEVGRAENSAADARGTVDHVAQLVNRYGLHPLATLGAAGQVTSTVGSGETASARLIVASLAKMAESERQNIDTYVYNVSALHRLENSAADTAGNIDLISTTVVQRKVDSVSGFRIFERQLQNLGSGNTAQARQNYQSITNRPPRLER